MRKVIGGNLSCDGIKFGFRLRFRLENREHGFENEYRRFVPDSKKRYR